jgi:hypothetical protein
VSTNPFLSRAIEAGIGYPVVNFDAMIAHQCAVPL